MAKKNSFFAKVALMKYMPRKNKIVAWVCIVLFLGLFTVAVLATVGFAIPEEAVTVPFVDAGAKIVPGSTEKSGTFYYSVDGGETYSEEVPTFTEPGEYNVLWFIKGGFMRKDYGTAENPQLLRVSVPNE